MLETKTVGQLAGFLIIGLLLQTTGIYSGSVYGGVHQHGVRMEKQMNSVGVAADWGGLVAHLKENNPDMIITDLPDAPAHFSRRWRVRYSGLDIDLVVYVYPSIQEVCSSYPDACPRAVTGHEFVALNRSYHTDDARQTLWAYRNIIVTMDIADRKDQDENGYQFKTDDEYKANQRKLKQQSRQRTAIMSVIAIRIGAFLNAHTVSDLALHQPTLNIGGAVPEVITFGRSVSIPLRIGNIDLADVVLDVSTTGEYVPIYPRKEAIRVISQKTDAIVFAPNAYGPLHVSLRVQNRRTLLGPSTGDTELKFYSRGDLSKEPVHVFARALTNHEIVESSGGVAVVPSTTHRDAYRYLVLEADLGQGKTLFCQFRYLGISSATYNLRLKFERAAGVKDGKSKLQMDSRHWNFGLQYTDGKIIIKGHLFHDGKGWILTSAPIDEVFFRDMDAGLLKDSRNDHAQTP